MKRLISTFLFVFLLAVTVNGAGLNVNINTVDNLIMVGEEAVFDITVKNEQSFADKFTFVISDLNWEWNKQFFDIRLGGSQTFTLRVRAPEGIIKPNRYTLNLKVYSTTHSDAYIYEPLLVTVFDESSFLNLHKISYPRNGLNSEKEINTLGVIIKNQYDKMISNVDIILESDIFDSVTQNVDFAEAELKTINFDVMINSRASEGWHDVRVLAKKGESTLMEEKKTIFVKEHSNVKEDSEVSSGFLVKKTNVVKINEGTTLSEESYKLRLGSFERLFSDTEPKPSYVEKSGNDFYYVWNFNLNPGEEYSIYVEINYRDPLILIIVLAIIIYLVIYLSESGASIKKKVLTIKSKDGINYMKILLMIKNKGKREIKNLRIVDQLFNAKTIPTDYGTLRPSRVNRKGENVVLVWDNITLVGKEERILSYRVNVEIKNRIILPRAMVKYRVGKISRVVKSNSALVVG